jgi:spore coat protein U-like protein
MKALQIVRALAAVAALSALSTGASAQVTGAVSVNVTLTSQCRLQTTTAPVVDFGTYVAFGGGATASDVEVKFECTRGYGATPTASWDTTNGNAAGVGVLAGLEYQLTANETRAPGAAATATTGAGADIVTYTVGGTMAGNQPGQDSTGVQSHSRTLTVTF